MYKLYGVYGLYKRETNGYDSEPQEDERMSEMDVLESRINVSKARERLSPIMDDVLGGRLRVINRRRDSVALVRVDDLEKLLALAFPFEPEVYFEEDGVAIWLPELAVGGEGDRLDSAEEALLDAVLDYVSSWEEELKRTPDHARRYGWVYRVLLADRPDRIREMLFGDREAADIRRTPSFL